MRRGSSALSFVRMKSPYLKGEDPRQLLEKRMRDEGRLPPGQSANIKWPVLHEGAVPRFDPATWDFKAGGLVETPVTLTWDQMKALPRREVVSDFHCVTRWSTFDNRWEGVAVREILSRAVPRPEVLYVMAVGHVGERDVVDLDVLAGGDVALVERGVLLDHVRELVHLLGRDTHLFESLLKKALDDTPGAEAGTADTGPVIAGWSAFAASRT